MDFGSGMRGFFRGIFLFSLLVFTFLRAAPASEAGELKYLTLSEISTNLAPEEVNKLKEIFDKDRVIDVEASNLLELSQWLDQMNARLTNAVEAYGSQFPFYKIYILSSSTPDAYIYKFRPRGYQFYRGHVFISTGMLQAIAKSAGGEVRKMNEQAFSLFLRGLQGILAHEFSHPKEDELVKWDWRAGNNQSRQNHAQADEAVTDLMGMRLLRDAGLEPEGMLNAIQLLPVYQSNDPALLKAVKKGIGSHPETELRINVLRGALTRERIARGSPKVTPVPYDEGALRSDLNELIEYSKIKNVIENEFISKGVRPLQAGIKALRRTTADNLSLLGKLIPARKEQFFDALDYLVSVPLSEINDQDAQEFVKLLGDMDHEFLTSFLQKEWYFYNQGSGRGYTKLTEAPDVRGFQRRIRKMAVYQHPLVRKKIQEIVSRGVEKNFVEPIGKILSLLLFVPAQEVIPLLDALPKTVAAEPPANQADILLTGIVAAQDANAPVETEIRLVQTLTRSIREVPEVRDRVFHVLTNFLEGIKERRFIYERFVRPIDHDPAKAKVLADAYADFYRLLLATPDYFFHHRGSDQILNPLNAILMWSRDPSMMLYRINEKTPKLQRSLALEVLKALQSAEWSAEFKEFIRKVSINELNGGFSTPVDDLVRFMKQKAFESEFMANGLFDVLLQNGLRLDESAVPVIKRLLRYRANPVWVSVFLGRAKTAGAAVAGVASGILENLHANQKTAILSLIESKGLITRDEMEGLAREHRVMGNAGDFQSSNNLNSSPQAVLYWRHNRALGIRGTAFLDKILPSYSVEQVDETTLRGSGNFGGSKETVRAVKQLNLIYHPDYASYLNQIAKPLVADLLTEITGLERPAPQDISRAFHEQFDRVLAVYKRVFDPDGVPIPIQHRKLISYNGLDKLAEILVPMIPSDLSYFQKYDFWKTVSSKRVNKYTDAFFRKEISPQLPKTGPEVELVLGRGLVRSEQIRIRLIRSFLAGDLEGLKAKRTTLTDSEVHAFTQRIQYFTTEPSRFRDDYLEEVAWGLQLDERRLQIFIEPMKSFNFKAVDLNLINLLSTIQSVLNVMTIEEKLSLIRYLQNPVDSIFVAIPRLNELTQEATRFVRISADEMKAHFDRLEAFIRDAGENEKLVLIESVVGTRQTGLWYKGQGAREEMFKLARLEGAKRTLFETYIKALPEWEQSIHLSYLMATAAEGGEFDLFKILDLFQTPGWKFAQMASVFNLFGEEESAKLATAKSRASPPSRLEIYELLKARLSATDFKQIRSLDRLLGSGSIKYVVSVTFEDGRKAAVYVRRPDIEESITSTLNISERWMKHLREDPEFRDFMDYDYYLASLRDQLEEEIRFDREAKNSLKMANIYEKEPSYRGWSFRGVRPAQDLARTEDLYHYHLIENAVEFEGLSPEQQKVVSEMILKTEVKHLFNEGDADRHLGNFLFDPVQKIIYPIDMGQAFKLESSWSAKSEPYLIAQLLYAIQMNDPQRAASSMVGIFKKMQVSAPISIQEERGLVERVAGILESGRSQTSKILLILGELNKSKVRLPFQISLGVIKGLSIVLNEKYAGVAGRDFVVKILRDQVRFQLMKGKIKEFAGKALCGLLLE
ncbi:MAG: hypothetical protein EBX52_04755 [Proteobacteria bacterium]|nr:hypothetical protein [Pseudomonadota bacterium]